MKNTRWMLGAVLTVLTAFAGIASIQPGLAAKAADGPASAQIKIDNFTFGPTSLTVSSGTTVTWINNDDVPHTVVSDDKDLDQKRWIPTTNSLTHSQNRERTTIFVPSIRR